MFHAVCIKPGEKHVCALGVGWQVTTAALDKSATLNAKEADSSQASVLCLHKEGVEYTMCTLRPRTCEQVSLDFDVQPRAAGEFSVTGKHAIHLTGVLMFGHDEDESDEEMYPGGDDQFEVDVDGDDSDNAEWMPEGAASYGSRALAALVMGEDLEDDDSEFATDDEDDDDEDEDEDDEDESEDDGGPVISEISDDDLAAFLKSVKSQKRTREGVAVADAQAKSPSQKKETPAKKSTPSAGNGEPKAKRKVEAQSPTKSSDQQQPKKGSATTPQEKQQSAQKKGSATTPQEKQQSAQKKGSATTPQEKQQSAQKKGSATTPQEKQQSAQKKGSATTPQEKQQSAQKKASATTPQEKQQSAQKKESASTPQEKQQPAQKKAAKESPAPVKKEAAASPSVQKLSGGLTSKTIKAGSGKGVSPGQRVFMRYRGKLAQNNKEFDSNMTGKPFAFRLGKGEVIKGWDIGVKGMKAGEVRELRIPASLGYGPRGAPPSIPGNSTLLFTVELLRFK